MDRVPPQDNLPPTRPYFIRALYEWCCDHGFTPYLQVMPDEHTQVPLEFVREGQIVLNVHPESVNGLQIDNDQINFQARFSGKVQTISIPIGRIAAIYSRENGVGMGFDVEESLVSDQEKFSPVILGIVESVHQENADLDGEGENLPSPQSRPRASLTLVK